jgi:hypothetical protein
LEEVERASNHHAHHGDAILRLPRRDDLTQAGLRMEAMQRPEHFILRPTRVRGVGVDANSDELGDDPMNPASSPDDQEEQSGLANLKSEELQLNERLNYFSLTMSTSSSSQIQGYINELYGFLAKFLAWRATATYLLGKGRAAYSHKLEELIQRVQYNLDTYRFTYSSRTAFEQFQQNSGRQPGLP